MNLTEDTRRMMIQSIGKITRPEKVTPKIDIGTRKKMIATTEIRRETETMERINLEM